MDRSNSSMMRAHTAGVLAVSTVLGSGCASSEHLENFGTQHCPVYVLKNDPRLPSGHKQAADFAAFIESKALSNYQKTADELPTSVTGLLPAKLTLLIY